ncbi:hypothetical protein K435DRAFT_843652 [Dendrothele bispora CBS 962.96]|uniref:Heterokaryon incompatibility domain-containing protein n=1 Tax=Dendrothele bispora (strain CBS 962.96) TaxID=1314807 RepID=A0A4S8L723_DENBC|nr:hypothetical protein K435DRAFT_843652 [Dendrothele bispora CBS 962.96]
MSWGIRSKTSQSKTGRSLDKLHFILRACVQQKHEYIWLDVLCIRQGRNDPEAEKDKKREMSRMHRYYSETSLCSEANTLLLLIIGIRSIELLTYGGKTRHRTKNRYSEEMDFGFCHLIDWTYAALGTETLNSDLCKEAEYSWIHPGGGIVNDKGWWRVSQGFLCAIDNDRARRAELHPLEALVITKFRESRYEIDKLRGVYGMIDERWHVIEETDFKRAWEATKIKYITDRPVGEHPDLAPLVTMSVTKDLKTTLTWDAGESERMGSIVPQQKWTNESVLNGPPKTVEELEELTQYTSDANAVSSGLREIFTGRDRWIRMARFKLGLFWHGSLEKMKGEIINHKELVDGQTSVYRKVGIAFVDSVHPGPKVDAIVV